MLIKNDRDLLGDKLLNMTEGLEKRREDTKKQASQYRIPDQEMLEDREMAQGWPMDWREFVRRVSKLNPRIQFLAGAHPRFAQVRFAKGDGESEYVSGFYLGRLTEFSYVAVDDMGLPVNDPLLQAQCRGWREVLLKLIQKGALTEKQVELTFGPALGQRAILWDRSMHAKRNSERKN